MNMQFHDGMQVTIRLATLEDAEQIATSTVFRKRL